VSDWGGQPTFEYPAVAKRLGIEGTNTFLVVVDPEGRVVNLQLKKSGGHYSLDEAARNHIRKHLRLNPPPGETREILVDHEFRLQ
jgi:TonB family protein